MAKLDTERAIRRGIANARRGCPHSRRLLSELACVLPDVTAAYVFAGSSARPRV